MNIHQTEAHVKFLQSIGWIIEKNVVNSQTMYAFIRPIPGFPIAFMKLQRVKYDLINWNWVNKLERKYHIYQTVIELDQTANTPLTSHLGLKRYSFISASDFMLNTKTRILDLSKSETDLLKEMKSKTRYNIHLAHRDNLQTTIWNCESVINNNILFEQIYSVLKNNARRINMLLLPKDWIRKQYAAFGKDGFIIGITRPESKELLAVATFYCSDTTCSYNLNGSTDDGRLHMAPTLALWTGIQQAKQLKVHDFDFDGVFDERYPKTQSRFQGFGKFKAGFGGQEVYFYPMYKRWRYPWRS